MRGLREFHHHPDGWIYVKDGPLLYVDTVAQFAEDVGGRYSPPECERLYTPGVRHFLLFSDGRAEPQSLAWPEGDRYIAMIGQLLDKQRVRAPAQPVAPDARALRLEELRAKRRNGLALTRSEQTEVLDLLLGV